MAYNEKKCCDNLYFEITRAQGETRITNGTLIPGALYKITDRGDNGIFLNAISTNEFSKEGIRLMLVPQFYGQGAAPLGGGNWLGVWHDGLTPDADDLVIWGGLVWKNENGLVGDSINDAALDVEWILIDKDSFLDDEYIEMQFNVSYDWENDWIEKQWDGKGNEFGINFQLHQDAYPTLPNFVDLSDWNYASGQAVDYFYNNKGERVSNNTAESIYNNIVMIGIYNNSVTGAIFGNIIEGAIWGNSGGSTGIYENNNLGSIFGNSCTSIALNSNHGSIYNNSCVQINANSNSNYIANNTHDGDIRVNINNGFIANCTGSGGFDVVNNINNGNINNPAGLASADISDTVVNK